MTTTTYFQPGDRVVIDSGCALPVDRGTVVACSTVDVDVILDGDTVRRSYPLDDGCGFIVELDEDYDR